MNDIDFLIQSLVDIVKKQFQSKDVEYCIKFMCCSTNLSNAGRQKVMVKHKSHSQKELHAKRKKGSYAQMEPAVKKQVLSNKAIWYKSLDPAKKKSFYLTELNGINHWIPKKRKSFCPNQQIGINHLVLQKNKIFCLAEQFGINHWILHKNKREQNDLTCSILHKNKKRAEWYKSLNPEEKEKLLSGRAEWYKTLDPADKDKIISQVQVNKEAHRNSVQHDLDHRILAFQSKIREGSYYICSVCNRILYRKTFIQFKKTNV